MSTAQPRFSIGVTTFERPELLALAIASIRQQTFEDFEVIIGNDSPTSPLSPDEIGVLGDPRIHIINHQKNLGEIRNMNALLAAARGRYFTWLADDDAYAPGFLAAAQAAFVEHGVRCVFTSYTRDADAMVAHSASFAPRLLSGAQFVSGFLNRSVHALGCYGVFDTESLRSLGGMEQLGRGFSPYSDTLLALRAGRLDRIAYIDAPLVLFRAHEGSKSAVSADLAAYHTAQEDFCTRSLPVLLDTARDASEFEANLYELLSHYCVSYYCAVARRGRGSIRLTDTWRYTRFMARYAPLLGSTRQRFTEEVGRSMSSLRRWSVATRARQVLQSIRTRVPALR